MNERVARCLLVSRVLVADGMMAATEQAFLAQLMERLGLSDAEQRSVRNLEGLEGAAAAVGALSESARREILDEALTAALVDGKLSPLETQAVAALSADLGLA